jgi:protein O-mannosyl-transferase
MTDKPTGPTSSDTVKWHLPLALLLIAGLTVAVYWPSLFNDFIDYDDPDYVTVNMMVRQGLTLKGVAWAFSAFHAGNWHPLTWLSHMLDVELFALNPLGHHATNLLIHTLNSVMLCALLHRLTGFLGRSVFVALLFAVHPLHVESVAWIAERKDVLSTLFWLLTMWAYSWYAGKPSLQRYLAVVVLFALGLMSKQMLVTLPLILLLMDYWPLQRLADFPAEANAGHCGLKRLLAEKVPLLLMSAAASLVTITAQNSAGALARGEAHPALLSAGNACLSYLKYIGNMLWPADLALFYPFEQSAITAFKVAMAVVLLAAITAAVVRQRIGRPYLVFGWLWYLVTLLPVIGFIRVGGQAMADRYTYIPLIGLFLMVSWGGAEIAARWRKGPAAAAGVSVMVIAALSLLTVRQIHYWQNSYQLYSHALSVVEGNWLAHNNIGILLSQNNRNEEALFHFQESVRLNPRGGAGFRNLGNSLQMAGRTFDAIQAYNEAVRLDPNDTESHFRLGYAYLLSGAPGQAYEQYRELLRLDETQARALLDSIAMQQKR